MRIMSRLFPVLLAPLTAALFVALTSDLKAEPPAKEAPAEKAPPQISWEFEESLYTNSAKTDQRVWQYRKPKHTYRDPNSWFDSPHMSYPFNGNWNLQPNDVFPYPYSPGPNAEYPSYSPDPIRPIEEE